MVAIMIVVAVICLSLSIDFSNRSILMRSIKRKSVTRKNYPLHPSIWMMGMLNQNTPRSLCDYKKSRLTYRMFWNELLFDKQVWIIDTDVESIRRIRTMYRYSYPYPKFYRLQPTVNTSERMKRISQHTRMRTPAYELQQWSTFYFDMYADRVAKAYSISPPNVIAIVDADAQLQTFPTLESIFPESNFYDHSISNTAATNTVAHFKLRAFGLGLDMFSEATQRFLGKPQVSIFMVTFPVYIYSETLKNLRNYVEKFHNMSFDDAFEKTMMESRTYYSQFVIILSYAYWFEREKYSFHIQPWPDNQLAKIYSDLVPHSIPQPRIFIHTKKKTQTSYYERMLLLLSVEWYDKYQFVRFRV
jgi:hypothetical protein